MLFTALPELVHSLIHVRPMLQADIPAWAAYLNDPIVYTHTSWNHPTIEDLSRYVGNEQRQDQDGYLRLAVALRTSDEFVGTVGFHSVSTVNRTAELTYDLAPTHWGKGFTVAAAGCLVDWAHQHCGFIRVQATILDSNVRSRQTIERLGFQCEGLLRSFRFVRGTPGDYWMFAHIRNSETHSHDR